MNPLDAVYQYRSFENTYLFELKSNNEVKVEITNIAQTTLKKFKFSPETLQIKDIKATLEEGKFQEILNALINQDLIDKEKYQSDLFAPSSEEDCRHFLTKLEEGMNFLIKSIKLKENKNFQCPITLETFKDPYVDNHGHTFEKSAIDKWMEKNTTCPISIEAITSLAPNYTVKQTIEESQKKFPIPSFSSYKKENPKLLESNLQLAEEYLSEGEYKEALKSYAKAFEYTQDWRNYIKVPEIFSRMGEKEKALLSHLYLIRCQIENKDYTDVQESAIDCFNTTQHTFGRTKILSKIGYLLLIISLSLNQIERAKKIAHELLLANPGNLLLYFLILDYDPTCYFYHYFSIFHSSGYLDEISFEDFKKYFSKMYGNEKVDFSGVTKHKETIQLLLKAWNEIKSHQDSEAKQTFQLAKTTFENFKAHVLLKGLLHAIEAKNSQHSVNFFNEVKNLIRPLFIDEMVKAKYLGETQNQLIEMGANFHAFQHYKESIKVYKLLSKTEEKLVLKTLFSRFITEAYFQIKNEEKFRKWALINLSFVLEEGDINRAEKNANSYLDKLENLLNCTDKDKIPFYEKLEEIYLKSSEKEEELKTLWLKLGDAYSSSNQFQKAEELFKKAVKKFGTYFQIKLALSLSQNGKIREGVQLFYKSMIEECLKPKKSSINFSWYIQKIETIDPSMDHLDLNQKIHLHMQKQIVQLSKQLEQANEEIQQLKDKVDQQSNLNQNSLSEDSQPAPLIFHPVPLTAPPERSQQRGGRGSPPSGYPYRGAVRGHSPNFRQYDSRGRSHT